MGRGGVVRELCKAMRQPVEADVLLLKPDQPEYGCRAVHSPGRVSVVDGQDQVIEFVLMESSLVLDLHVIEKLRGRLDTRHQQIISCPSTGDVQQVALGIVDLLQIGVVADRLNPLL